MIHNKALDSLLIYQNRVLNISLIQLTLFSNPKVEARIFSEGQGTVMYVDGSSLGALI